MTVLLLQLNSPQQPFAEADAHRSVSDSGLNHLSVFNSDIAYSCRSAVALVTIEYPHFNKHRSPGPAMHPFVGGTVAPLTSR